MVTLFGILETGARAVFSQQVGLDVTGHNIANANTEGFSRQRANFATTVPLDTPFGIFPTGVQIQSVTRLRDEFLDFQIRQQSAARSFYSQNEDIFGQLQVILQDPLDPITGLLEESPSESGLNSLLQQFFNSFQDLAAHPESLAIRSTVRETAVSLARGLNIIRNSLEDFQTGLDNQVADTVGQINSLVDQIAQLNEEISKKEFTEKTIANDLRDTRDHLLTQLSDLVPITTTEQSDGTVDVRVFNVPVVTGTQALPLEAVRDPEDPVGFLQIINSQERSRVLTGDIDSGKLGALLQARDQLIPDLIGNIDSIAQILIREVNNVHSRSIGLTTFTSLTGETSVDDSTAPLDTQLLDFPPDAGTLTIRVTDSDGVVQNLHTVSYDPSVDTLTTLAAAIDSADGSAGPGMGAISATVNSDNQLEITSNGGLEFTFQGDTGHILAPLGLNRFFAGTDASNIAVSDFILDPDQGLQRIAASATGAEGDNGAALEIAGLGNALIAENNTSTVGDFYRSVIAELGERAQRNKGLSGNLENIVLDLKNRQESVAGVSLDEESVNLIRFQQAFNAAARYITTVDSLIDRVVNGLGVTR